MLPYHTHTHAHTHTCTLKAHYLVDVDWLFEVVHLISIDKVGQFVLAETILQGTHTLVHLIKETLTHMNVTLTQLSEADCGGGDGGGGGGRNTFIIGYTHLFITMYLMTVYN